MIWKQSGWASHKDTAVFIGDENKFQELVNEIYGVETFVPCEVRRGGNGPRLAKEIGMSGTQDVAVRTFYFPAFD